MSVKIQGTLEKKGFGPGVWTIVTAEGKVYELQKAPKDLLKAGLTVEVEGEIQADAVSFAMVGPILAVKTIVAI